MGDPGDDGNDANWFSGHDHGPLTRVAGPEVSGRAMTDTVLLLFGVLFVPTVFILTGLSVLDALDITEANDPAIFFGAQTALNFVGFLVVGIGYLAWRRDPSLVGIRRPTRRDLALLVGGFLALVTVMLGFETLFELFGVEMAENDAIARGRNNPELFLLFIPIQFLLTGPGEELIFRGLIQGLLRQAYGVLPAILVASIVFALFHIPALGTGSEAVPTLVIIFASGALLGALYEYSGNLLVPVVVHASWNALVFASLYVSTVGMIG